jgi:hypothetical protein
MKNALTITVLLGALAVFTAQAMASRCPAGSHWDEWSKTCRSVR